MTARPKQGPPNQPLLAMGLRSGASCPPFGLRHSGQLSGKTGFRRPSLAGKRTHGHV